MTFISTTRLGKNRCRAFCAAAVVALALAPDSRAQSIPVRQLPTAPDVVDMAWLDIQRVPIADRQWQRYYWIPAISKENLGAHNYGLNTAMSRASVAIAPDVVSNGSLFRLDLRKWAPVRDGDTSNLTNLVNTWEGYFDPYFHANVRVRTVTKQVQKKVAPYMASDGRTYDYVMEDVTTGGKTEKVYAPYLLAPWGNGAILRLSESTKSSVPIVHGTRFLLKALDSNPDVGGLYYQLRGIGKSRNAKLNDEQWWLLTHGASIEQTAKRRSKERSAMEKSLVTGKPRRIEFFWAMNTRPSLGPSLVTLTHDYFDGRIKASKHPLKNLLSNEHDGSEDIVLLPSGAQEFALFNGDGALVQVAPQQLVADRRIPDPHTTNLVPALSCIRCHASGEGYRDAPNEVKTLVEAGADIFYDAQDPYADPADVLDKLQSLYDGDPTEALRLARNTHSRFAFRASGGMQTSEVMRQVAALCDEYRYMEVTPLIACRDLGYAIDSPEHAHLLFDRLVPKLPTDTYGRSAESLVAARLRTSSLSVTRDTWEEALPDIMLRMLKRKGEPK